ncbi:GCN5 family acetyltransferase [Methylobacterium sp. Leaf104]|uniref:GNAT family N-acetyltransferase n=1 Tax=Methylobacterium TaxID=407 RepID=UPI0006F25521|nr:MULTISPECIES: GNAT family N-acetyltransferase [Methylobacterium]KQP31173.1 GCN5 family acetyltransferase [Methylobacterium sp. Leaf104]MCI9881266.1 GNAT family N-acetyltransferase [Methylobacterium goesingense]
MPEAARLRWRALVERRLPEAAGPDWPVQRDHCFARILLDNTCGGPWRESVPAPAWANLPLDQLAAATELGEAVLTGRADLFALNRRSLALRGKLRNAEAATSPERLRDGDVLLRPWQAEDEAPFAALNADPEVMRHFPAPKDAAASRTEARACARRFAVDGFGPWAVEMEGRGFVGMIGGARLLRPMPFPGGDRPGRIVEIGWRLARSAWGLGIATRGARLALADLFGRCGLHEIVAFTAEANTPSRRVMERLGMRPAGGFPHPALPSGHPLRPHLLYRLQAGAFEARAPFQMQETRA